MGKQQQQKDRGQHGPDVVSLYTYPRVVDQVNAGISVEQKIYHPQIAPTTGHQKTSQTLEGNSKLSQRAWLIITANKHD